MNGHSEPRPTAVPAGGLLKLVGAETRLAAALAAAEDEARALVQAARDEVAELATRVEAEIEMEAAALATRISADSADEIRRIATVSEERCRRLRDLPAQRIEQLAAEMEGWLLQGPHPVGPGLGHRGCRDPRPFPGAPDRARSGIPPGTGSGAAAEATAAFEDLTELLLEAANRETLLSHLGEALARTSRQVNTLERRLQPALQTDLSAIRRTLDEREREEHVRLERLVRPARPT